MPFENLLAGTYQNSYGNSDGRQVRIPTLRLGQEFDSNDATSYPSDMNLVAQYKAASNSVVRIEAVKGRAADGTPTGSVGTGFIVTSGGEVATDYHVVKGANNIKIQVGNISYPAVIEAVDQASDLALLKINANDPYQTFRPLQLAPSSQMRPGDVTIALGYPKGDRQLFMSPGGFQWAPGGFQTAQRFGDVVSRLKGGLMPGEDPNRTVLEAAVNVDPGNSGGPLLNNRFQVVGIVDIATTGSTRADATVVEDLHRLMAMTSQSGMRSSSAGYGFGGFSQLSTMQRSSILPWNQPTDQSSSYYGSNQPTPSWSSGTAAAATVGSSFATLARMLGRSAAY